MSALELNIYSTGTECSHCISALTSDTRTKHIQRNVTQLNDFSHNLTFEHSNQEQEFETTPNRMDNLHTLEETNSLKKLREEYERQLKSFGVELCDLPDECTAKLNECIQFKMITHLHDLGTNYLQEYYFIKKKEQIDHDLIACRMRNDIRELEEQIEEETKELNQLEDFKATVSKRLISEAEMENHKISIEEKIKDLLDRQKSFVIPEDINVEELITKLELLEKRTKNTKNS